MPTTISFDGRGGRMGGGAGGRGQRPTPSGSRVRFAAGSRSRPTTPARAHRFWRSAPLPRSRDFHEGLHVDASVLPLQESSM